MRLILHCIHAHMETIVVAVRDTYVLLLLLAHYDIIGCIHLYMKAGTSNAPKYFPVHEIRMLLSNDLVDTLLAFHAITGCDSVSQFTGHGKKTAWAVFKQHHTYLVGLGKGSLTEDIATSTEKFICKIYGVPRLIHATKHGSSCFVSVVHKILCHQPQMQQSFTSCVHTIKQVSGTKHTRRILIFLQ